jgi:hypothetical protein
VLQRDQLVFKEGVELFATEIDRKRSIRHTLTVGPKLCARSIKAAAV